LGEPEGKTSVGARNDASDNTISRQENDNRRANQWDKAVTEDNNEDHEKLEQLILGYAGAACRRFGSRGRLFASTPRTSG